MKSNLVVFFLCLLVAPAHGALIGRAPMTVGGTDFQAYYDEVADISWLKDASYADTSGYLDAIYTYDPKGLMTWYEADEWVGQLDVLGFSAWRLPTQSEMSHLHYDELGGTYYADPYWVPVYGDIEPFINIGELHYWSSAPGPIFNFTEGTINSASIESNRFHAWAVADGDVFAAVPIPAAAYLFASGLGLLGWFKRR